MIVGRSAIEVYGYMRTKERVRDIGEVFTNKREIDAMLDLIGEEAILPKRTILEPACGNGNFLIEILTRRLDYIREKNYKKVSDYERNVLIAVSNVYGIDIMEDNIEECRDRLFAEIKSQYDLARNTESPSEHFLKNIKEILATNIILGDSLNKKSDINFIKYMISSKGIVSRTQHNLAKMEQGVEEPAKVFEEAHIKHMPSIKPDKLAYYMGDQINLFLHPDQEQPA